MLVRAGTHGGQECPVPKAGVRGSYGSVWVLGPDHCGCWETDSSARAICTLSSFPKKVHEGLFLNFLKRLTEIINKLNMPRTSLDVSL